MEFVLVFLIIYSKKPQKINLFNGIQVFFEGFEKIKNLLFLKLTEYCFDNVKNSFR